MKTKLLNISLIVLLLFSTGCIGVNERFKDLRNDLFTIMDENPETEIEFGLGSGGLALAGSFVRFAEEDKMPADLMSLLKSIQIGVYKTSYREFKFSKNNYKDFSRKMKESGWTTIVRVMDYHESSMVFVKSDISDGIKEMIFVTRNGDELIIGELKGNLEKVVATIIRNKSLHVEV